MIILSELKELICYDYETGIFTYKKSRGKLKVGSVAGSLRKDGYLQIKFNKKSYLSHRLAWFYVYGYFPKNEIDHINGNKEDNRILNLRECTRQENEYNKTLRKDNKTGYKGVSYRQDVKKYVASIRVNKIKKYLGFFDNEKEAYVAYINAARKYHGEFLKCEVTE